MLRHYEKVYCGHTGQYLGLIFQDDRGQWMGENRLANSRWFESEAFARGWLFRQVGAGRVAA